VAWPAPPPPHPPALPPHPPSPPTTAERKLPFKEFAIASADGNWSLKIGALMQLRFTYERLKGEDPADRYAFSIPRARVSLSGTALTKRLGYEFVAHWDKGGIPGVKDAYIDFRAHEQFRIRFGQYKKPFDREELTSDSKLEFGERSIVAKPFGQGRDIGLMFHNGFSKSPPFEYALGVFNGTSDKTVFKIDAAKNTIDSSAIPKRFHPMAVARVGYNYGDLKGYSEADLEGGPLRFGGALGTLVDFNLDDDSSSGIAANVDVMLKAYGFALTGGGFLQWIADPSSGRFKDQVYAGAGLRGQLGYTIMKLVQPAFRYARLIPKGTNNDVQEIMGAVNFYPFGHDLQVQIDGGANITEKKDGSESTNGVVRVQAALAF
jgi:hypothetical protein